MQHVGTSVRQSIRDQFHPFVGAHLELGGGPGDDNIVFGGASGLSWKQRIPVPMRLTGLKTPRASIEARGLMLRIRCARVLVGLYADMPVRIVGNAVWVTDRRLIRHHVYSCDPKLAPTHAMDAQLPRLLPSTSQAYSNVQFPALTTFQGPLASRGSERFEATSGIQAAPGQALTVHIDHYNLIFDL